MTSTAFGAGWLALREPVDHRSRSAELTNRLAEWWARGRRSTVLDLGSGTGSNLRYLAPRLTGRQTWTLVDNDEDLLARSRAPSDDVTVRTLRADLADIGSAEVEDAHLVTASALLDLVSPGWMERLASECADSRCGALFALTYDGTVEWRAGPTDSTDALVRRAVNAHQLREKGLGPALGPAAAAFAEEALGRRGFRTWTAASPWRLGPRDSVLARELVTGWASAATEERPHDAARIDAWAQRRHRSIASGDFGLLVGHIDLLALPATRT